MPFAKNDNRQICLTGVKIHQLSENATDQNKIWKQYQIFSYAWFIDDKDEESFGGLTRTRVLFLHILQLGLFARYVQLLLTGYSVIPSNHIEKHRMMFAMRTDLSMLRLFEIFLESTPQLLLQLYVMFGHNHTSIFQYLCILTSFLSIAWTTVEYRSSFRRSQPEVQEMPSGLPTAVYLFYKLFTITSRVLSLSLLVVMNVYCSSALVLLWLCGTIWAHKLKTDFCTCMSLEWLYRGIIGVVLIFTFFNVKGQDTKLEMTIYYGLYASENLIFILLFYFLKYLAVTSSYFLPVTLVIAVSKVIGLFCLIIFYTFFHPRSEERIREIADEVDFRGEMWRRPDCGGERRRKAFLQH
ncbi:hypothetical protein GJAV_G00078640 [Gymnothorax javanicus]|nr:hypothetical protein GJAV_G00078640 [Gymnothorax javanicus]